jgi:hypothetical protein
MRTRQTPGMRGPITWLQKRQQQERLELQKRQQQALERQQLEQLEQRLLLFCRKRTKQQQR